MCDSPVSGSAKKMPIIMPVFAFCFYTVGILIDLRSVQLVLRNTPVLLIGEATASLDNETSFEVLDAILKLDGYTRIIVTHDLDESILRRCTGVFTLKKGEICEQGTFDELIDKKGYFYSLFTVSQK